MKKLPKCYKTYSKKDLRKALLKEMQCNIQIVEDNRNIVKHNDRLEIQLQSAENAIMSQEKVIEKYKDLLSHSVENL